jgi:hypothetical protein
MTLLEAITCASVAVGIYLILLAKWEADLERQRAESIADEQRQVVREQCRDRALRIIAGGKGVH